MKKLFLTALAAASILSANAQDSTATETATPLVISGSIDTYYKASPNNLSPSSSFADGETGFNLGMANVILEKAGEKSGFVADLVFGPRGDAAVFNDLDDAEDFGNNYAILNQLYAYWNVTDGFTLTLGNFNTFLGYEVISPTGNFNYSTSYMFSNGPFSHTGLKADFTLSDDLTLMASVMNATDNTSGPLGVNTPSFGLQLGIADMAWLNFVFGDQSGSDDPQNATFQADITTGADVSDEFYLGFNATYNTTSYDEDVVGYSSDGFYGAALYAQYAFSDAVSAGIRGEYFAFHQSEADAISVIDLTASLNYTVGSLTFIPEFRIDLGEDFGATRDTPWVDADGEALSALPQFYLAAVYAF